MSESRVSVIIPTFMAGPAFAESLVRLCKQTLPPAEMIVVDSSSSDNTVQTARDMGCNVAVISQAAFNHGGTRNLGAKLAHGDILVFMTQDAIPADDVFLENLTRSIREGSASAAYARQIALPNAPPTESYARLFNYPADSHVRTHEDIQRMGIKAFFFSNVASAVSVAAFRTVEGFPERIIMNEDMLLCAKLLQAKHTVAYEAQAKVLHSHDYSLQKQFKRYFDMGVAISQAGALLQGVRADREGVRFALGQVSYLVRRRAWTWVPRSFSESIVKYIAFKLGLRERYLSKGLKRQLSMHNLFWERV